MKLNLYYFLGIFILLSISIVPLFIPAGGVSTDSISYFVLADEIPNPSWSLFPLGYPFFLKLLNYIFDDYYWSGRVLNVLIFITIFLFSYIKQFYFRETIILMASKIFVYLFYYSISEPLFLACLYFLFYYIEGYFTGRLASYKFYLPASLILTLCFTVRYSGVYIALAFVFFYLLYYKRAGNKKSFFRDDFFYFLLLGALGIISYMSYNYYNFQDLSGERFRSDPYFSIGRNIIGLINSFNPVLGVKLNSSGYITWGVEFFLLSINLFFIYWFIKIWKKEFDSGFNWLHFLFISTGLIYSFFLFLTYFYQGIEEINIRMAAESSFCYFFSIIILYFKQKRNEKTIYSIAVFSLVFAVVYTLKNPSDFLERKIRIESKLSGMKGKKYFFNNLESKPKETIYHIPIINKEIKYIHQNMQNGYINGNIIMTKDVGIRLIEKDTVKNKKEVIYATDLE